MVISMQRQFPVFALHCLTFKNARPVFFARMCVLLKKTGKVADAWTFRSMSSQARGPCG